MDACHWVLTWEGTLVPYLWVVHHPYLLAMARSCQLVYQSETVHCGPVLVCCSHLHKQKTGNLLDLSTLFPCRNTATYYIYESQNVWREFWKERDLGFKLESTLSLKQIKIQKRFTLTPKSLFSFTLITPASSTRKKKTTGYYLKQFTHIHVTRTFFPHYLYCHLDHHYHHHLAMSILSFHIHPHIVFKIPWLYLCNLQFLL